MKAENENTVPVRPIIFLKQARLLAVNYPFFRLPLTAKGCPGEEAGKKLHFRCLTGF